MELDISSDDCEESMEIEPVTAPDSRKKVKRKSRIVMNRKGDIVLCRTFSRKRSRRYSDMIFKKPDLSVRNVATARLLPCCSRDICAKRRVRPKCKRHKKKKYHTMKRKDPSIVSIYENVSSGSLESDIELDRLIAATRKRMRDEIHQRVTPKLAVLEPSNDNCSVSTFDLNSVHSMDTVKLDNIDEPEFEYHSPVNSPSDSPVRNIKIEPNNNDILDYQFNNEFHNVDIKPNINIKQELW